MAPTTKNIPEILAPAGGMSQFFAALHSGADAVYLGLKNFNARSRAENFTIEELRTVTSVARLYDLKVLVTLNILIKESELPEIISVLSDLETSGIYAVIVQDLGLVLIIRNFFPSIRIHASTQMAIHNVAGVLEAARLGLDRVVLARELSAQELRMIRTAVPRETMEIEAFCHGSLCYSYSGLCFFSGIGDARSGNRGECAYTCREPYKILNEPGHGFLFSMGDLDTSESVEKFITAGVDTLKIEGRKKDAQYVSTVVKLYRKKLDDIFGFSTLRKSAPTTVDRDLCEEQIRSDLAYSFSRKPTSFFFNGRYHENVIDLDNPTHRGVEAGVIFKTHPDSVELLLTCDLETRDGVKLVGSDKTFHAAPQDGSDLKNSDQLSLERYQNRDEECGVERIFVENEYRYLAKAGQRVRIFLNPTPNRVRVGTKVFKTRSSDLRERVQKLETPKDRARNFRLVSLSVISNLLTLNESTQAEGSVSLELTTEIKLGPLILGRMSHVFSAVDLSREINLESVLRKELTIFGDFGIQCEDFLFNGVSNVFIPPKDLKKFKKQLGVAITESLTTRAESSLRILNREETVTPLPKIPTLAVKIDRLEYLDAIFTFQSRFSKLKEIVIEPKRSFASLADFERCLTLLKERNDQSSLCIRLAIPAVVRLWDNPILSKFVEAFSRHGFRHYEIANLGGLRLLESFGINSTQCDISGDFTCYTLNHFAAQFWSDLGVTTVSISLEDDRDNMIAMLRNWPSDKLKSQLIVYKDSPLFIAEACSLTALHNGCPTAKVCGYRTLEIENSKGDRFFVAHESCRSIVYAEKPYSLSSSWKSFASTTAIDSIRVDFLTKRYTTDEILEILHKTSSSEKLTLCHAGNFNGHLL